MKNSIINYENEEVNLGIGEDTFTNVRNYFSKKINVFELLSSVPKMLDMYRVQDNDKIERISYELYGTADYWDMLILLNDIRPLYDIPTEDGEVSEKAQEFANIYSEFIYSHAPLLENRAEELYEEYKTDMEKHNESVKYIYIIKPAYLSDFITILREHKFI